ncbi:MAG: class I SAM-dependent methyltransferase [Gammaproteobacteria bacterium]|nr:class I SAM-dependent methyltransferase [Gammaproteobacteria bacterium]
MELNEAEIQVLATIYSAETEKSPVDKASLEESGKRYLNYLEDWSGAYSSLVDKGLIVGAEEGYHLTESGRPLGLHYLEERPDNYCYYYQEFYDKAHASEAHSQFCENAFGLDLCQEGQMDMNSVHDLLDRLNLKTGQRVLDLGCGAGGISEYISDETGTRVTGLDFSSTAITVAKTRTENKRSQLNFIEADLNKLELEPHSYDAAISIDSIYWVNDTVDALRRIVKTLKPGGQLILTIVHIPDFCDSPEELEIDKTFVATALDKLKLDYQSVDRTESFLDFWPRVKRVMSSMKEDFEREGNGFIYENWIREAETEFLPPVESGDMRRYLYHVHM